MRYVLVLAALATVACNGDRLTGTAAQDAVEKYQNVEVAQTTAPIVLLDGKEITIAQSRTLDSKTIESVQVFKGKAALDKYGARANNGVIVIERKAEFQGSR